MKNKMILTVLSMLTMSTLAHAGGGGRQDSWTGAAQGSSAQAMTQRLANRLGLHGGAGTPQFDAIARMYSGKSQYERDQIMSKGAQVGSHMGIRR